MRRAALGLAAVALLTGCSTSTGPLTGPSDTGRSAPPAATPGIRHDAGACAKTPEFTHVVRTGYGLDYRSGSAHVAVNRYDGAPTTCVEFAKSGPPDPQVPPDTLLFTFTGSDGEGLQIEFPTVALTGGVLPPLGDGYFPRVGPLTTPINARVGAAVNGAYYLAEQCSLLLTRVDSRGATGRFDCPAAGTPALNPFAPSDDVDYAADDTVPPPPIATLGGWFELSAK